MKVFKVSKQTFNFFGIIRSDDSHKNHQIIRILISILILFTGHISMFYYFVNETNDFIEYTDSFYYVSGSALIITSYCLMVFQTCKISRIIDHLELILKSSM